MKPYLLILALACGFTAATAQTTEQVMNDKQRSIAAVASLTAVGELDRLESALGTALDNGMTVNELREVLVHTYAYCGFPRALRGLQTLVAVLNDRKAQGIADNPGREASPVADIRPKYDRGRDILAEISGTPADAPKADYALLAPEIEIFLKEHLFADLFERDVLTYAERELATVAVIASLGSGVEPMLKAHAGIALHVGVTPGQLHEVMDIIRQHLGPDRADAGRAVLNELLLSRNRPYPTIQK